MVFERVLCGIDGTPESAGAARQVALLTPSGAAIVLVGVTQPIGAAPPGFGVVAVPLLEAKRELEEALEQARGEIRATDVVETRLIEGAPIPALLQAVEREGATLVAVGVHGRSRAVGIALGSVATAMLHDSPVSVYAARRTEAGPFAPRSIAVGVDGSPVAATALEVARELAERLGADLRAVCALGGKEADLDAARTALAGATLVEDARHPIDALVEAGADLVVVGSRGLHGLRALGSVSERVAHRARTSVLVVREQAVHP